ncbi:hypothetical protein SAMN02910417_00637 [Eubacterium oxidoreducens]|uniref:DUF5050 domain-containing protein n=2 Tax=Eubacterium oxidoreducens TaxID=1732 RepID=A0A1G6AKQ6_EUBOX|nr:hypothetical protein SAMN02910417_00637 [Eubacterium oxidoreducens]
MGRKTLEIILVTAAICALCGCDSSKDETDVYSYEDEAVSDYNYFSETAIKGNEVLLYNTYEENLGVYNTDSKEWEALYSSAANNLFAYGVKGQEYDNTYYTIGSSGYNKFSVVKFNKETHCAESVYDVVETDSLCPIGYYNENMYFIHGINDLGDSETRALAYIEGDEIVDFYEFDKPLVSNGVIINDDLYYTEYLEDEEAIELYDYSLKKNKSHKISKIDTDYIYRYNDELLYIDSKNNLRDLNGKKYYSTKEDADLEVLSDYGLLLQVYVDEENDISADIVDIESGEIIKTEKDFDGYIIDDSKLNIYCEGQTDVLEIEKTK